MHILFLSHYFPPEVNAPASRTYENAKRWVRTGHDVTLITCAPNHPDGIVYPGYGNRLCQWDEIDGIKILRVKTYLSANKGFFKRTCNYVSYMLSATAFSPLVKKVDVVVSTSPQFFCGCAGFFVSRFKRCPWVLEIRDLWPESIIAVGAIRQPRIIQWLESLETSMYHKADHIIPVTQSFKHHIMNRDILPERISVVTNGADLEKYTPSPGQHHDAMLEKLGLKDKFIVSYIGTHGMAHALRTVLLAADLLREEKRIVFMLVGGGAERDSLLKLKEELDLPNVLMLPQQPKEKINAFLAISDVCMVLLKKDDLFKTVIPSKMFEAMAMERPVILGVEGESKMIVESAQCGLCIEPENYRQLAENVRQLFRNPEKVRHLGQNGRQFVTRNYNREHLADQYLGTLEKVVANG